MVTVLVAVFGVIGIVYCWRKNISGKQKQFGRTVNDLSLRRSYDLESQDEIEMMVKSRRIEYREVPTTRALVSFRISAVDVSS